MRRIPLISLLALVLTSCATPDSVYLSKPTERISTEPDRELLVGKWLGEATVKEGGSKMWLNERSPDGTYVITFRNISPNGSVRLDQEYGIWGLSGSVYFTKMQGWIKDGVRRPHRGSDSYFDDAYLVKSLTLAEFVYEAVTTKKVFRVKKVPDDYRLP